MKTAVVLSDTHGRGALGRIAHLFSENDLVVHLGDGSADMRKYLSEDPERFYICKGNCDFAFGADEYVIEEEGVRMLCCHGHRYGVKSGRERLAARARELDCALALYGHTHRAEVAEVDGVLCINPGALGSFTAPSYCYLVLHKGKATPNIVTLV